MIDNKIFSRLVFLYKHESLQILYFHHSDSYLSHFNNHIITHQIIYDRYSWVYLCFATQIIPVREFFAAGGQCAVGQFVVGQLAVKKMLVSVRLGFFLNFYGELSLRRKILDPRISATFLVESQS